MLIILVSYLSSFSSSSSSSSSSSYIYISIYLIGPITGSYIADLFGNRIVFVLSGLLVIINIIYIIFKLPETVKSVNIHHQQPLQKFGVALVSTVWMVILLLLLLLYFIIILFLIYLSLYLSIKHYLSIYLSIHLKHQSIYFLFSI